VRQVVSELLAFSSDEQRLAVEGIADALRPLAINVMVLGRVALLYLFGEGRASKDVDVHPYPMGSRDFMELHDQLEWVVKEGGGRVHWEPDGRSITVYYPIKDRHIPVELILGGEDWIDPHVLEDAIGTGSLSGNVLVPSPEHLFVMKAEAYYDRQVHDDSNRFKDDMVQIVGMASRADVDLDPQEVRRLIMMRPPRKHTTMMDLCATVLPS
jgi:hypothetical protein